MSVIFKIMYWIKNMMMRMKKNEIENDEKKDEFEKMKYDQKDGKQKAPKVKKTDPKIQ